MTFILPLVRIRYDDAAGLAPETVTVREFRVLQYEYCAWLLADAWLSGRLVYVNSRLPDIDDKPHMIKALCLRSSADDIVEMGQEMCMGRTEQRLDGDTDIGFGYDIAPVGLTDTFGYDCVTVVAWLNVHPNGPALFLRRYDDTDELVDRWLESWARTLDVRKPWPETKKHTELLVPQEFINMRKASDLRARKKRPVRRFIGLSR